MVEARGQESDAMRREKVMSENWLPIVGYEGLYSVSDFGRVRSEDRMVGQNDGSLRRWKGRIMKASCPKITGKGRRYPAVGLYREGVMDKVRVQYLVMAAFVGPRPPGMEVLHWDDDPNNNALTNLRYGTHAENKADEVRNNTHCRSGKHEWTSENTYIRPDSGTRICRGCIKDNKRKKAA